MNPDIVRVQKLRKRHKRVARKLVDSDLRNFLKKDVAGVNINDRRVLLKSSMIFEAMYSGMEPFSEPGNMRFISKSKPGIPLVMESMPNGFIAG